MLIGSYEHMLDAKGRVFIPARWRESLGDTLIVTIGLTAAGSSGCLFGMSVGAWTLFSHKLSALPVTDVGGQAIRRRLYSMAAACDVDKQGRILIPAGLRDQIGLAKDATLIGVDDRIEIWTPEALADCSALSDEAYGEALTHLAEIGI